MDRVDKSTSCCPTSSSTIDQGVTPTTRSRRPHHDLASWRLTTVPGTAADAGPVREGCPARTGGTSMSGGTDEVGGEGWYDNRGDIPPTPETDPPTAWRRPAVPAPGVPAVPAPTPDQVADHYAGHLAE